MKSFRKHLVEEFNKAVKKLEGERKLNVRLTRRISSLKTVIRNTSELLEEGRLVKAISLLARTLERLGK